MFRPNIANQNDERQFIAEWGGYNHNPVIGSNEFYDMKNLTGDHYPLLAPRKTRRSIESPAESDTRSYTPDGSWRIWDSSNPQYYEQYFRFDVSDVYGSESLTIDFKGYIWGYYSAIGRNVEFLDIYDTEHPAITVHVFFANDQNTLLLHGLTPPRRDYTDVHRIKNVYNQANCEVDLGQLIEETSAMLEEEAYSLAEDGTFLVVLFRFHLGSDASVSGTETAADWAVEEMTVSRSYTEEVTVGISGIFYGQGGVAYVRGGRFFYRDYVWDFSSEVAGFKVNTDGTYKFSYITLKEYRESIGGAYVGWQQIIQYGVYLLVFPLGLYFNTTDFEDKGTLGAWDLLNHGAFQMCDSEGNEIDGTWSKYEPINPNDGDIWVYTNNGEISVSKWYAASSAWFPFDVYTKIWQRISGWDRDPTTVFKAGDMVRIETSNPAETIFDDGNSQIIRAVGKYTDGGNEIAYIILDHAYEGTWYTYTTFYSRLWLSRPLPRLDYACASANRVWGCYYGQDANGDRLNEIYATKLGDPTNWAAYAGLASDSYAVSIGSGGKWTGAICYQGLPTFFKENRVYKIYGDYPASYQLQEYEVEGVQDGSANSLAICNQYLFYKSPVNVCMFDGSVATDISGPLGQGRYFSGAAAGACLEKYYISMQDTDGYAMYVYDTKRGAWYKDDDRKVSGFAYDGTGRLIAATDDQILSIESLSGALPGSSAVEQYVEWFAETGDLGLDTPDHKRVSRITLRVTIPYHADLQVDISCDDDDWTILDVLRGNEKPGTQTFSARPVYNDHFRLRFSGHGDVRIYSMAMTMARESEEG